MKKISMFFAIITLLFIGCNSSDDNPKGGGDSYDFDRKPMLENWADNIIIPSYSNYVSKLEIMDQAAEKFSSDKNSQNLNELRNAYKDAYIAWQKCSFYEVGPANNNNLRLFTNTYPTNGDEVKSLSHETNYNFHLKTNAHKQGFPAIDYLLNGIASNDDSIVNEFNGTNGSDYTKFLNATIDRLLKLSTKTLNEWKNEYRDYFVNNSGSSASASVDVIANDYLLYYEKYMRNGKVRFPVGLSDNTPNAKIVEAYYSPELSKILLRTSVEALRNFYEGKSFGADNKGLGFRSYLVNLKKENVATKIDSNFSDILSKIDGLGSNLSEEVENNRSKVLELHDAIQNNVKYLKVDMLQSMGIVVAYFDGDGD